MRHHNRDKGGVSIARNRSIQPARTSGQTGFAALCAAAIAAGLLNAASFGTWSHWVLNLLAMTGLFCLMNHAARRGATAGAQALLAGCFSMAWFASGLSWLYISMHDVGGMPAAMAALAVLLFAAYLSLYPAAASWLAWRVAAKAGPFALAVATGGAWTLGECLRGWVFTGFPWLSIGYAQIDGPMAGMAPLVGVFGVGGLTVTVAALWAATLVPHHRPAPFRSARSDSGRRKWMPALVALGLLAAPLASSPGQWTQPHGPELSVRLLQGNVPQDLKFRPDRSLAAMQSYLAQFESGGAALTLLPETAWTVPWNRTPPELAERVLAHTARGHAVAIGMPLLRQTETGNWLPTNSVVLFSAESIRAGSAPPQYDKRHLVPFGEFVPWGFGWFVKLMNIPLGDFGRGRADQMPFEVGGQRVALNICYEDLFGEEIREALRPERDATVLANISNIAWFGQSNALPQHLQISRMRSLETGRPMLRATNTGMTAAIDAQGRVVAQLPPHVVGALDVKVQGTRGLTPFARFGNLPAILLALAALLGAWMSTRKSR